MATSRYGKGCEAFGNGDIDWLNDDIRVVIVDTADYTVNLTTDNALDDIPSGARVAVSGALTGKTNTLGVLDAADKIISGVTGDPSEAAVVYKHTGTESTSLLISYHDSGTGFPLTPNGEAVTLEFSASGVLAI